MATISATFCLSDVNRVQSEKFVDALYKWISKFACTQHALVMNNGCTQICPYSQIQLYRWKRKIWNLVDMKFCGLVWFGLYGLVGNNWTFRLVLRRFFSFPERRDCANILSFVVGFNLREWQGGRPDKDDDDDVMMIWWWYDDDDMMMVSWWYDDDMIMIW